jgi:DNA-binding FrmR family transcriptional regulator
MNQHNHQHKQNKEVKQDALHRIKIIQGHLNAIEKMIERDEYCVNVIHQSMAVQKALKRLDILIMENHLKTCVVDQIKHGGSARAITELKSLYEMK